MLTRDEVEEQVRAAYFDEYAASFNAGSLERYVESFAPGAAIVTEAWDAEGRFVDRVPDGFPGDIVTDTYVMNVFRGGDDVVRSVREVMARTPGGGWRSEIDDLEVTAISPVMALIVGRGQRVDREDGSFITPIAGVYIMRLVDGHWKMVIALAGARFT